MILDSVLNEAYIPNNPTISKIVNIFEKMSKVKISENNKEIIKLINELKNSIKKFTNANRVQIDFDNTGICFTMPPRYSALPNYKITKNGIIFDDNTNVFIYINMNPYFIFNEKIKLTPREITAILLHEIGHNFSHSLVPIHDILETIKISIQKRNLEILRLNNEENKMNNNINDSLLKKNLQNILLNTNNFIQNGKIILSGVLSSLSTVDREHYMDEKIADSFATIYGFGKDLSSALYKLNKFKFIMQNKKHNRIDGFILGTIDMTKDILFSEHPQDITRLTNQINQLEYELSHNKALSENDKIQLKKDIRGIKTVISQYTTINKSDKFNLPWKLYYKFITDFMGGEEIMNKLTTPINQTI